MKLSIIIPCYNEEKSIPALLREIENLHFAFEYEVIIIDDGSRNILKPYISEYLRKLYYHYFRFGKNMGKGTAIRMGIKKSIGDYIIFQDADLEYFPSDIPYMIEYADKMGYDVVYGTRFKDHPKSMSASHFYGNMLLTKITNFLFKVKLTDMETGYKLFSRRCLESIELNAREFELEPEITAKLLINGYRINEISIKYKYRREGEAKINPLDGIEAMFLLFQLRFAPNSRVIKKIYSIFKFHIKPIYFLIRERYRIIIRKLS